MSIFLYKVIFKLIVKLKKNESIQFDPKELNFGLINFNNQSKIKTVYWKINDFSSKLKDDKSLLYHSFEWLNYAKKMGGASNIKNANFALNKWIFTNNSVYTSLWSLNLISSRFVNVIYNLNFISLLFDEKLKKKIFKFLYLHFLLMNHGIKKNLSNANISDLKALFLGSCIYNRGTNKSIKLIDILITEQVDSLGFHKSYNALEQAIFINHLHEIKNISLFFKIPGSKKLIFQINNMISVMQNLFHQDKSLILFNGSRNSNLIEVNKVLNLTKDIVPKKINSNEKGIVFYRDEQKSIFMDIVKPVNKKINNTIHASTLAFELSCLGEKIITNCGSINREIMNENDYLRYSAAHSTIIVNNTNISELNKKSYRRVPDKITFSKQDEENFISWTSSHNGYIKNYKKIVTRKIKIMKNKNEIIGEDSILSTKSNSEKILYHIRFHLMPNCNCILTNNKKTAIIRIKDQSWLLKTSSLISMEDSIYVNNENKIQQTKQLVLTGYISDRKKIENWIITKS